jgi:hypothetical protein
MSHAGCESALGPAARLRRIGRGMADAELGQARPTSVSTVLDTASPGDLLEIMFKEGWILENEKPCRFVFRADARTLETMTTLDGTQVWRNPRL